LTPLLYLLLQDRLSAGLWRVERFGPVQRELAAGFGHTVNVIDQLDVADKSRLMDQLAVAFGFPDWFGRNWDALYDSLVDAANSTDWPALTVLVPAEYHTGGDILDRLTDVVKDVATATGQCFLIVASGPPSVPPLSEP
jgi:RNAse (barnase) inhibitor barstar